MKKFLLLIIAILAICPLAILRADGPPVNQKTGKLTCKSIKFKMDTKQVSQAERVGYIELTNQQIDKLKKINKKFDAKLLMIVPVPYQDCTCGMGVYGIWNKNSSFEIPYDQLKQLNFKPLDSDGEGIEDYGEEYDIPKNFTIDSIAKNSSRSNIFIGLDGKIYIQSMETPVEKVFSMIDEIASIPEEKASELKANDVRRDLYISAPVLTDKKVKTKVFATMKLIKDHAKKKNVSCWDVVGYDDEELNNQN